MPLGETISAARKKLGYSQKELAEKLMKDEGGAISAQYLNDIEHDRRQPSSESLLRRLAEVLEIPIEVLLYQVGQLPADVRGQNASPERIQAAYQAFRRNIEG
ncbi:MAG: XRE family transcriptional regulator [Sorangiineae bacterium PRO1]|nr:XRE family transcriptional regulator [Sorangiineae bacterium PRO1]RIL03619.1 MAG: XRE family transcriptional regulator [bacterium]